MKKNLLTILLAVILLPLPAAAQKWIEPAMRSGGTFIPGHWATTGDGWQKSFSTPGTMNPFTGQFNRYDRTNPLKSPIPLDHDNKPSSAVQRSTSSKHYSVPGSTGPDPYLIPGSNAPNPYAAMGSKPNIRGKQGTTAGNQQ